MGEREGEWERKRERVSEGILMPSDTLVIDDTMKGEGHVFKRRERQNRKKKEEDKKTRQKRELLFLDNCFRKTSFLL